MQIEWQKRLFRSLFGIVRVLPFLLLFYSFAKPAEATLSVVAVLLHEGAHLFALSFVCKKKRGGAPTFSTAFNGFRLKSGRLLSYGEELFVLAAGPLANLFLFAGFSFLPFSFAKPFASVNLLTALGNLFPVMGYDGYRIAELLCLRAEKRGALLPPISLGISLFFTFVSLYAILRANGGYFAFFAFLFEFLKEAENLRKNGKNLA